MASTERYTTDKGTFWLVRYRTPTGSQTKKRGFKTKREAELFLANNEVRKATGDYVKPSLGRVTVGELAIDWLARRKQAVAATTACHHEYTWRLHVAPRWESVPVASIDVLAVEAWIAAMVSDGTGMATVRKAYGLLGMVLNDAVKGKRISTNPARVSRTCLTGRSSGTST